MLLLFGPSLHGLRKIISIYDFGLFAVTAII